MRDPRKLLRQRLCRRISAALSARVARLLEDRVRLDARSEDRARQCGDQDAAISWRIAVVSRWSRCGATPYRSRGGCQTCTARLENPKARAARRVSGSAAKAGDTMEPRTEHGRTDGRIRGSGLAGTMASPPRSPSTADYAENAFRIHARADSPIPRTTHRPSSFWFEKVRPPLEAGHCGTAKPRATTKTTTNKLRLYGRRTRNVAYPRKRCFLPAQCNAVLTHSTGGGNWDCFLLSLCAPRSDKI